MNSNNVAPQSKSSKQRIKSRRKSSYYQHYSFLLSIHKQTLTCAQGSSEQFSVLAHPSLQQSCRWLSALPSLTLKMKNPMSSNSTRSASWQPHLRHPCLQPPSSIGKVLGETTEKTQVYKGISSQGSNCRKCSQGMKERVESSVMNWKWRRVWQWRGENTSQGCQPKEIVQHCPCRKEPANTCSDYWQAFTK